MHCKIYKNTNIFKGKKFVLTIAEYAGSFCTISCPRFNFFFFVKFTINCEKTEKFLVKVTSSSLQVPKDTLCLFFLTFTIVSDYNLFILFFILQKYNKMEIFRKYFSILQNVRLKQLF